MIKKFGKKRYFLNPKEGVAAASFIAEVEEDFGTKGKRWPYLDTQCYLELSDESDQVTLDLHVWIEDTKKKTLAAIKAKRAKVERLQEIVNAFAESALESFDYIESRLDDYYEAYNAKKNQKKK